MNFFPDPPAGPGPDEHREPRRPDWSGAPVDVVPAVVPVELVIGRSDTVAVLLTGLRAFPTGVEMNLAVRVHPDTPFGPLGRGRPGDFAALYDEVFDNHHGLVGDTEWEAGRLKWGVELADGRRATNVDLDPWSERYAAGEHPGEDDDWTPDHPVLHGGGGGGSDRAVDRSYWLWPLPPAGRLGVVCQWPARGIAQTVHDLDADLVREAAARARPLWPDAGPARP